MTENSNAARVRTITDAEPELDVFEAEDGWAEHLLEQVSLPEEKVVWNFHKWLRIEYSDLSRRYRLNLRKAAYNILVVEKDPSEVANGRAAFKKLQEFAASKKDAGGIDG